MLLDGNIVIIPIKIPIIAYMINDLLNEFLPSLLSSLLELCITVDVLLLSRVNFILKINLILS
ncbi:hypothetical protein SDC9_137234 [bioreactor metagenome]|uniref:Uncharacterized protein n=1 Tax=bioreactor metagenome TaxID=1076179 RepID=A0A645DLF3_9ZZZZ